MRPLAALALLFVSNVASAATFYNVMRNIESQLCIDVPGLFTGNTLVQQYPCNYGNNQFWRQDPSPGNGWVLIKALHSGKCLEIAGFSTANGQRAQHYTCNGGWNQLWYPIDLGGGEFAYYNGYSGKCLDVAGGTHAAGFHLQQYTCHYGDNQRFEAGEFGVSVSE